VSAAAAHALEEVLAEATGDALARRKLGVRLRERPPAPGAAVAALAPHQVGHAPRQRQVAHAHPGAILDVDRAAPAARATPGERDQLDLEVEPVAPLDNALHLKALETDEAAKVILHPLLLLAPRSMTTQSLVRAADVSS
jgi:hypothetical protein